MMRTSGPDWSQKANCEVVEHEEPQITERMRLWKVPVGRERSLERPASGSHPLEIAFVLSGKRHGTERVGSSRAFSGLRRLTDNTCHKLSTELQELAFQQYDPGSNDSIRKVEALPLAD